MKLIKKELNNLIKNIIVENNEYKDQLTQMLNTLDFGYITQAIELADSLGISLPEAEFYKNISEFEGSGPEEVIKNAFRETLIGKYDIDVWEEEVYLNVDLEKREIGIVLNFVVDLGGKGIDFGMGIDYPIVTIENEEINNITEKEITDRALEATDAEIMVSVFRDELGLLVKNVNIIGANLDQIMDLGNDHLYISLKF